MYKSLRKKVASSVNDIEAPDQFEWSRWLRTPPNELWPIDRFYSYVKNIEDLNLVLSQPSLEKIDIEDIKHKVIEDKFQKKYFVDKVKTNKIFFKLRTAHVNTIPLQDKNSSKILFSAGFRQKKEDLLFADKSGEINSKTRFQEVDISLKNDIYSFQIPNIISTADFNLPAPNIFDYLNTIDTKITNVQLLTFFSDNSKVESYDVLSETPQITQVQVTDIKKLLEELYNQRIEVKIENVTIDFLSSAPKIVKVKTVSLGALKVPTYYLKNTGLTKTKVSINLFKDIERVNTFKKELIHYEITGPVDELNSETENEIESETSSVDELLNDQKLIEELNEQTETDNSVDDVDIDISTNKLSDLQRKGIRFLTQKKICLLSDEPGIDKHMQVTSALKALIENNIVKSFLIISAKEQIGDKGLSQKIGHPIGWEGYLTNSLSSKSFLQVSGDKPVRQKIWAAEKACFVTTYKNFSSDLKDNLIDKETKDSFDCIILDDSEEIFKDNPSIIDFIKNTSTKYVWYLSNLPEKYVIEDIENIYKRKNFLPYLRRSKDELIGTAPELIRKDVWVDLDEEQQTEYENVFIQGKEKISKLLEAGNPFIIQSNIYTFIHQLKQICNFAENKSISIKSNLLLKQIDQIISNNRKVIISSQYDKAGINKIEEILNENGIKYLSCKSGMSINEVEKAKQQFKKDNKVHVLINGLKSSRSSNGLADISYFIHFDQWWNPSTIWRTEDLIARQNDDKYKLRENTIIYEYFTRGTFEEDLHALLSRKGLLNKDIVELITAETINNIITVDEWLEVLRIKQNENDHKSSVMNKLKSLSTKDLSHKIEILFNRLGYKNISIDVGKRKDEYNLVGTMVTENKKLKITAKCLLSNNYTTDEIMEKITDLELDKNSEKKFLILLSDSSENILSFLKPSIIVINKELLANYFANFLLI